jgi:hypothetical protein
LGVFASRSFWWTRKYRVVCTYLYIYWSKNMFPLIFLIISIPISNVYSFSTILYLQITSPVLENLTHIILNILICLSGPLYVTSLILIWVTFLTFPHCRKQLIKYLVLTFLPMPVNYSVPAKEKRHRYFLFSRPIIIFFCI